MLPSLCQARDHMALNWQAKLPFPAERFWPLLLLWPSCGPCVTWVLEPLAILSSRLTSTAPKMHELAAAMTESHYLIALTTDNATSPVP